MKDFSSDVIETSIELCADEVDPFAPHGEEVGSPLNRKEESTHCKEMDSKKFLGRGRRESRSRIYLAASVPEMIVCEVEKIILVN